MKSFDPELVFFCGENCRVKLKELAVLLKKSSQRLKYNLYHFEREEILFNPYVIFDYALFGQLLFRVYFKGGYVGEKHKKEILNIIRELPYIVSAYELEGEFDMVIEIQAPNASRFNKELKKLITIVPSLNDYKVVLNIVTHLYPRSYLLEPNNSHINYKVDWNIIVGGDRKVETFTDSERDVIKILLRNPKIRFSHLAKAANMNIKTARAIFRDLEKRKIIKGFKYIVNTHLLEISKHRLFLKLHNSSPEREALLMEYFTQTPEIVQINKTVGDWDLEIDIEGLDKATMRYLVLQMREQFTDVIQTFNSMPFFTYYQKSFLPEALFEEGS